MKKTILTLAISGLISTAGQSQCAPSSASNTLEVNNVKMIVNSASDLWWDFSKSTYEIPKGSNRSTTFSGGLWIGGKDDNGQLRLAVTKYRQSGVDFWPGPIDASGSAANCTDFDRVWKVSKKEIDDFRTNPGVIPASIKDWPGKNNPLLTYTQGFDLAPFVDVDKDGNYDPLKGDYPDIKGDEAMYWVFNDVGNVHTESNSSILGIEVHVMAYAYSTQNAVGNATFYEYTIKNKGNFDLKELHVGMFTDFDLGGPSDDFVGCNASRNLAYVYNGDPFDEDSRGTLGYGASPPLAGLQFVQVPQLNGVHYPLTSFRRLTGTSSTSPRTADQYYQTLLGRDVNGIPDLDPGGAVTTIQYPGLPNSGWSECRVGNTAGERKVVAGFGPMDYKPGEEISFTFANIFARDLRSDYNACTHGIQVLLDAADTVQKHFDNNQTAVSTREFIASNSLGLSIYPNPSQGQFTVSLGAIAEQVDLTLRDLQGRIIFERTYLDTQEEILNFQELKSGVYLLEVEGNSAFRSVERIIIE